MKKFLKYMIICIVLLFMYIPILVLAVYSFTDAANIGAIHAFSMHNYVTLFTTPELINMIIGSVLLAVGSAVLATILGTTGAIGAFYSKGKVKGANVAGTISFFSSSMCPQIRSGSFSDFSSSPPMYGMIFPTISGQSLNVFPAPEIA